MTLFFSKFTQQINKQKKIMKKLMLLFGLVAFIGTTNLSYASTSLEDISVSVDCDKCKDHKCDSACKKEGCTAEKKCGKDHTACKKGETKACCKKNSGGTASASKKSSSKKGSEGTASASKKSCCMKGTAASCSKKKSKNTAEK